MRQGRAALKTERPTARSLFDFYEYEPIKLPRSVPSAVAAEMLLCPIYIYVYIQTIYCVLLGIYSLLYAIEQSSSEQVGKGAEGDWEKGGPINY